MDLPLIIGHRGAAAVAPENTLISFERAIADGADGLEFDVHRSRDGVPVVVHDDTLRRTAYRPERIGGLTAKELNEIDAGSWFNRRHPKRAHSDFARARIPTLAQVFELCAGKDLRFYVELKGDDANELAQPVTRTIGKFGLKESVVILSFKHTAIAECKRVDPAIRTGALFEPTLRHPTPSARWLRARVKECGADEVALHYSMARRKVVEQLVANELPVVIWTADRPAWVKRATRYGIRAIITNDPARLVTLRNELTTEAQRTQRKV